MAAIRGCSALCICFLSIETQASSQAAEPQEIVAATYYNTFSRAHPVLKRVRPGDTVRTKTLDSSGRDENGVQRGQPGNPLTGPFYVEGAEPGDALVVRFTRVRMNRNWGYTAYRLGLYSLTPESIEGLYPNRYKEGARHSWARKCCALGYRLGAPDGPAQRASERNHQVGVSRQADARMCRCCAGGDFAPTSGPSGSYGGNLDYNEIGEGTVVMLPVSHPGALLFIGDGHALQGDGEPTGTGIETSMDVEFIGRRAQESRA